MCGGPATSNAEKDFGEEKSWKSDLEKNLGTLLARGAQQPIFPCSLLSTPQKNG